MRTEPNHNRNGQLQEMPKQNQKPIKQKPKQTNPFIHTHISHAVSLETLSQGIYQKVFKCTYTEKLTLGEAEDQLP